MKCCLDFQECMEYVQWHSTLNFHCLEKMFTNSNCFKNNSFRTAESDFSCQVYQLNYCYLLYYEELPHESQSICEGGGASCPDFR